MSKLSVDVKVMIELSPAAITAILRDYFGKQGVTVRRVVYGVMAGEGDPKNGCLAVGLNGGAPVYFDCALVTLDPAALTTMPTVEIPDSTVSTESAPRSDEPADPTRTGP